MTMSREVFLSILAMDSYQRGYEVGIKGLTRTTIGAATIKNIDLPAGAEAVGFFASAYDWTGTTVISYRGTDFDAATRKLSEPDSQYARDLLHGWTTFLTTSLPAQFPLARAFFKSVTGRDFSDGTPEGYNLVSNTIVTGHSLGGALAGFVDARVNVDSYLADPIPYAVLGTNDNFSLLDIAA